MTSLIGCCILQEFWLFRFSLVKLLFQSSSRSFYSNSSLLQHVVRLTTVVSCTPKSLSSTRTSERLYPLPGSLSQYELCCVHQLSFKNISTWWSVQSSTHRWSKDLGGNQTEEKYRVYCYACHENTTWKYSVRISHNRFHLICQIFFTTYYVSSEWSV